MQVARSTGAGGSVRLLVIMMAVLLAGCAQPRPLHAPAGVRLLPLRTISVVEAKVLMRLAGVKGVPVANAVDCYRMEYPLVRPGRPVTWLSGLLALPHGPAPRRLVSFQHGTATTRNAVPSRLDETGLAAAIAFAGNGYALIAPDYPGLGDSPGPHPYYVADAVGPSVVAMIDAARRLDGAPSAPVFLAGFSEGGWASLAALRILEQQGQPVLGSAQVAGAYDLRHRILPAALRSDAPSDTLYLAYAAWGQSAYYGRRLDSVMTRGYAGLVEYMFADAWPAGFAWALPDDPRQMFNQSFLDAFDHNRANWWLDAFAANGLTDVTPHAPIRLYYGSDDLDVPPGEALATARAMRARGADASAVDVGPVGHDPSMLAAAPLILDWLRELERGRG